MMSTMATIKDCTCPICLCILIEPVTMPCKHSICLPCYRQTVEKANLCCPLCRLRISVWARKSAKAGTLIDSAKWDAIRKAFPVQVQKRLEGKEMLDDDDDSESYETRLRQLMALSKPGEIREEYEAELRKLQQLRQEEAKMEEEASADLIRSLQQEEEREKEAMERLKDEQDRSDREIAEKLQETFVSEDDEDKLVEPEAVSDRSNKLLDKKTVSKNNKGKCKQVKQASTNNLTLATFFSPVPRETGASPDCGNKAARTLDVGSCGDAGLASHTFPHDVDFPEDSSHIPASKGFFSSKMQLLGHKHPSDGIPFKASVGNPLLEDPAVGCGVASRTNLNLETSDRFVAGPSGLGRCSTAITAAIPDLRTRIPANIAHEIPDGKHARTRQQLQPLEIRSGISSTQPFSYSVNEPSAGPAATVKYETAGMAFSAARPLVSFQQAQPSDAGERCSSREKVKLAVNPAPIYSCFHKPDCQLTESGDGAKWKCNNKVNDVAYADDLCGNYDNSCESSCHNDTSKRDSDDTPNSDVEDITKSDSDTCTEFPENQVSSGQQSAYLMSLEKHTKISNVKSKCNSEKENRIENDCKQYNNVKTNSKTDHHCILNPTVKVFRMKTHSVKKSKNSMILSPKGKKLKPGVCIMRWCVPNGCQGGSNHGLQTKNIIVDKIEPRKTNRDVLNHFRKRKFTVSSNNEEQIIFDGGKQINNNIHNDNRKDLVAKENDVLFSKKRKLKDDSAINSSSSVRQETSAIDAVDLDDGDIDQSGMSQEELDHLMAVQLQDMYSKLDKQKISVDRFQGSKDQYMLRRKTAKK